MLHIRILIVCHTLARCNIAAPVTVTDCAHAGIAALLKHASNYYLPSIRYGIKETRIKTPASHSRVSLVRDMAYAVWTTCSLTAYALTWNQQRDQEGSVTILYAAVARQCYQRQLSLGHRSLSQSGDESV